MFLVESFVEFLDYSIFEESCDGGEHPPCHPRVLLKLLVMGVLDRIRSSRNVARNTRENVVYMYLAEKLTPDFGFNKYPTVASDTNPLKLSGALRLTEKW